jgi:putative transcriptional regulator
MKYHPDIELLLKYSSGQLKPSLAVAVGLHQQNCEECQQSIAELESVGGETLETISELNHHQDNVAVGDFDRLFSDIEALPQDVQSGEYDILAVAQSDLPLVDQLNNQRFEEIKWKRVGAKVWRARLAMNDPTYEVELLKFAANTKIPKHTHKGNEFTVVLQGDFSDHQDSYNEGDFIAQNESIEHQPIAGINGCICLAITDAPLKFTGTFGPILNWFNR